ncbi:hypothetical protein BDA96_09G011500 [Sorghum bicolor]|uniref:Kinetochore protein SPC25 n=1 Tax=Sorghum bicolor TaxID=4558 RepID=A0A921U3E3_SORBI|nr:hypothetical protein BDA96_09G011500 [Sorghum bicolor]
MSSSNLEQYLAAALCRHTPAAATATAAPAGAGGGTPDLAAVAIQRQKAAQRARFTTAAFSAEFAPARSLADQYFSRREQVKGLEDQLRDIQSQRSEAATLQSRKEPKIERATEFISEATDRNEQLRSSVADVREKRNLRATITSEELQALQSLEAESNEGAETNDKTLETILWYEKFLGFRIVVGKDVKFVFNKIPQRREKEYSFRVSRSLQLIECDPHVKDIEELAKDLDLNEHLFKFARMAREKFQSSFMNGTLPGTPETLPVSNRSEDAHNETQSSSKKNVQLLPVKKEDTALLGASPGVRRRSKRLKGMR